MSDGSEHIPSGWPTPAPEAVLRAKETVHDCLNHPDAVSWLRRYYDRSGNYAGDTFVDLGTNDPDRIGPDDLFAVTLLSVTVPASAVRRILDAKEQVRLTGALERIPRDAALDSVDSQVLLWAAELHLLVKGLLGSNPWVTASKLCARKRPDLFPVRDNVVTKDALGLARDYREDWLVYRSLLQDAGLVDELDGIVREASKESASPIRDGRLRTLDALLWMSRMAPGSVSRATRRS